MNIKTAKQTIRLTYKTPFLENQTASYNMAGIYIHIPFCKQRCRYCAFYSSTLHNMKDSYVDALCNELYIRSNYINENIETIYLGGGTPSILSSQQLDRIFDAIHKHFSITGKAEITIEANPDDLTKEYLSELKELPFNRISMGVQSFNDVQLKKMGRRHNAEKAKEAVANARNAGFENISIDLMFALPGSTIQDWHNDLDNATALQPTHISAYNLTYEEGTPLYKDVLEGRNLPLDEEENIRQFEVLIERLTAAGYRHYEISNFALPGYESRHNSSYWHDVPYLGCGASAHSYNGTSRGWNISDINKYINGICTGTPCFEIEELSTAERYNDSVLTRLRTADGLPAEWVKEKFGSSLYNYMMQAALKEIAAGNLRETSDGHFALTKKGIFVSDAVMREFIYVE